MYLSQILLWMKTSINKLIIIVILIMIEIFKVLIEGTQGCYISGCGRRIPAARPFDSPTIVLVNVSMILHP